MPLIPTDKELQRAAKRKPRHGKPVKPSRSEEARLRRAMGDLWKLVLFPATERIKQLVRDKATPATLAAEIEQALRMADASYGRDVNNILGRWMLGVDREVQNALQRTMRDALNLDLSGVLGDPAVQQRLTDTLAMMKQGAAWPITSIPQEYLGKVAAAVADNFAGRPLPEGRSLLQQIQHDGEVSYRRAKLIARDQTSKLTAALNQHRQMAVGIETYIWETVRDERVVGNPTGISPTGNSKHGDHYHMRGQLCRWDDPTVYSPDNGVTWKARPREWSQRHPGEDIQCRCFASPVIDPERIVALAMQRR